MTTENTLKVTAAEFAHNQHITQAPRGKGDPKPESCIVCLSDWYQNNPDQVPTAEEVAAFKAELANRLGIADPDTAIKAIKAVDTDSAKRSLLAELEGKLHGANKSEAKNLRAKIRKLRSQLGIEKAPAVKEPKATKAPKPALKSRQSAELELLRNELSEAKTQITYLTIARDHLLGQLSETEQLHQAAGAQINTLEEGLKALLDPKTAAITKSSVKLLLQAGKEAFTGFLRAQEMEAEEQLAKDSAEANLEDEPR